MLWTAAFMSIWTIGVIVTAWWDCACYEACFTGKHFSWNQE